MNVASIENCKRLYKLSGWNKPTDVTLPTTYYAEDGEVYGAESWNHEDFIFPAYDAGYLLRKLDGFDVRLLYSNTWMRWSAFADEQPELADTPEDALCLLAIQLLEQGILTKEMK
jgi:hypothetical protein